MWVLKYLSSLDKTKKTQNITSSWTVGAASRRPNHLFLTPWPQFTDRQQVVL